MCGIAGIIAYDEVGLQRAGNMPNALKALSKRGPDGQGSFIFGNVTLGHARLSIIDTSTAASQPFTDPTGRYTMVFNGEIFNYQHLSEKLTDFHPVSTSDTEVLLHLYIQHGPKMLEWLNGFFAFALFDRHLNTVTLARDRMGIKPLLIHRDDHAITFGSEMKALVALGVPKQMDIVSLAQYAQFNYTPFPHTIFNDVLEMEPGTWGEVNVGAQTWVTHRFYEIPKTVRQPVPNYAQACGQLRDLLTASVQRRLIADVPLGAFLSGGVDSSVIVSIASKLQSNLSTFSIGYKEDPHFDESAFAEEVANHCGTQHTSFMLGDDELFGELEAVLNYIDRPFADSSALAVHILSRHTRKHVTVALSGDGADELFGGYNKHAAEMRALQPGIAERAVAALAPFWDVLPASRNSALGNKVRQLRKFAAAMRLAPHERYWQWASFMPEKEAKSLLLKWGVEDENRYISRKNDLLAHLVQQPDMAAVLNTDLHQVLRNDMLTKVDLMSMANSLEVRVPFLDHTVVDFVAALPIEYRITRSERKKILKDAFRSDLPPGVFNRPKHGFEVPLLRWFRTGLRAMIENDLLSDRFIADQGIFAPEKVKAIRTKLFSADPGDSATHVWNLLVFQHWWKRNMQP